VRTQVLFGGIRGLSNREALNVIMKRGLITVLPLLIVAGASAGTGTNAMTDGGRAIISFTNTTTGALSMPLPVLNYVPDDKYKLRIGDKISFQIIEDRDQPKSLTIADSGELDVPYLGRMNAVDKTCRQLAGEIKAQLEKEYYYRASVVLALDSANRVLGRVYVWGQVRNQGPIDLSVNENLTAGKALLRAGGFGDFANKKKVKVIRPATNGIAKQVFELNMVEILEDGQTEKDVLLQSDDSVIVGSRLINF
jgi:protein involved in polysaccharide export with SLBB domain